MRSLGNAPLKSITTQIGIPRIYMSVIIGGMKMKQTNVTISGHVEPGFEAVREAFVENFTHRNELGAACCIYYRGEKVVDLWGGVRNKETGEPWEEDTMVIVFSATKGMSGLAMALAHSRGLFDYDERISKYWPEFAQQGKDKITVRQLLAHQAGLFAFDETGDRSIVADLAGWQSSWRGRSRHMSRERGRYTTGYRFAQSNVPLDRQGGSYHE